MKKWCLTAMVLMAAAIAAEAAGTIRLMLPAGIAAREAKRAAAEQLAARLKTLKFAVEIVSPAELAAAPVRPQDPILGWGVGNFGPEVWQALLAHRRAGGRLIFQGVKENRDQLTPETERALAEVFGVRYLGYAMDPVLGQKGKVIEQYMFIRPDGPRWGKEHPPLFAVYAGEAFALAATDGGEVVGEWVRRDRATADGPAVIARPDGAGLAVFIGGYPFELAARNSQEQLASRHAWIMLTKFLPGAAVTAAAKKERYTEPLNFRPIEPAFDAPRSMWLWNANYALNEKERAILLDFMAGRRLSVLYMYTSARTLAPENHPALRAFIREAGARGIKVEALDGWKEAVLPGEQEKFVASLARVLDYNRQAASGERFSGFQSDVEPVTIKEYHASPESRKRYDRLYVELHARCAAAIRQSGQQDFVLGMAINENLDRDLERPERHVEWDGRSAAVLDHLAGLVDYFALMSYHDKAARVVRAAQGEVDYSAGRKIKSWVGVETLDAVATFGGSRSITFYEEGLDYMEKELEKIHRHFAGNPGYGGLAIHHYESYRRMSDGRRVLDLPPAPKLSTGVPYRLDRAEQVCYGKKNWHGAGDLSARLLVGWRAKELIVRAEVTDDAVVTAFSGEELWKSDHLEIWLNVPGGETLFQLGASPRGDGEVFLWHPDSLDEGARRKLAGKVEVKAGSTAAGYELECRIPAALLGLEKFSSRDTLRILLELGDTDSAANPAKSMMSLAPHRDREDPATWSELELLPVQR